MSEGKNLVGVDIGSSAIKVSQLREGRKGHDLVRLAFTPLPPQSIVDGHVMNSQRNSTATLCNGFSPVTRPAILPCLQKGGGRQGAPLNTTPSPSRQ